VHVEEPVELGLGDGVDRLEQAVARVVDEAGERRGVPGRGQRSSDLGVERGEGLDGSDVQAQRDGLSAAAFDLPHHAVGGLGVGVVREDHAEAASRGVDRGARADAAAAAGDHDDVVAGGAVVHFRLRKFGGREGLNDRKAGGRARSVSCRDPAHSCLSA